MSAIKVPEPFRAVLDFFRQFVQLVRAVNVQTMNIVSTATGSGTNVLLTGAQVVASNIRVTAGFSGAFTITLPTTAAIITSILGSGFPLDANVAIQIEIANLDPTSTGTITAGDAGTTLSGTMAIAPGKVRRFILNITSEAAITITNVGSFDI